MAVQRFVLDTSTLNDAAFGLDGPSAFILNQSTLDGSDALDGGQFLTVATGSASLGGLVAEVSEVTITVNADASAILGGLVASATTKTTKSAIASANLQGLVASATTKTTKSAIASANLHGLVASATTKTGKFAIASADLGGLVAVATGTVIPPEPTPEPTPSGGRQYAAPRRKKIEPEPVVEIPVIRPKRRYAVCSASLGGMNARGESTITFSILDDDAEVLLLV